MCFPRAGSVQVKCLSWTSTVHAMVFVAAIGIYVTWVICSRGRRMEPWLTPPCCTTALPFVPLTSMETGTNQITDPSLVLHLPRKYILYCRKMEQVSKDKWMTNKPVHIYDANGTPHSPIFYAFRLLFPLACFFNVQVVCMFNFSSFFCLFFPL